MYERVSRKLSVLLLAAALMGLAPATGCQPAPATLELIAVTQKALTDAAEAEKENNAELHRRLADSQAALDAAFDADVRLAETGKIAGPASQPVALSAEWVISARKGYAAARDALTEDARRADAVHATRLDNLSAAGEALDMANRLTVLQYSVSERTKELLLTLQRRLFNGP